MPSDDPRRAASPARGQVLQAAAGAFLIVVGAVLLPRPLTTLQAVIWMLPLTLLVVVVLRLREGRSRGPLRVLAGILLASTVASVVFTEAAARALPVVVAVGLAANALRLVVAAARSGRLDERLARIAFGAACAVAAVLSWMWPDVALLLVAWLAAITAMLAGAVSIWRAVRRGPARAPKRHRVLRGLGAVMAMVVAATAWAASAWALEDVTAPDDFYRWTGAMPETAGQLLRVGPYAGETPAGSSALRILYTTSRADGSATVASAVVAVPTAAADGDRMVLAWQHGTTGVAQPCAPSLESNALSEYAVPGISRAIDRGWVVVATDYPGQGTDGRYPYLIGRGEAQSTLDAVRAVRGMPDAKASSEVMLWGHSQGGHATLWAGAIANDYAPELDVVGVAALSAAADPLALAEKVTQSGASALADAITSYVLVPYADEYADIDLGAATHPAGSVFAEAAASRCVVDRNMIVSLLVGWGLGDHDSLYRLNLVEGPVHDRLVENAADGVVPAPLFLGQGVDDEVVPIAIQRALGDRLCATGRVVDAHEYPGATHMGVIAEGAPLIDDLFAWADAVLAGGQPAGCDV